ncbi:MAG: hypothetical protein AAFY60_02680 [Myxococcota bacterium]
METAKESGWRAVLWTVGALSTGAALCHLVLYPSLIIGESSPSLYRWFAVAMPLLLAAAIAGRAIQTVHDWFASMIAGGLALQLYEFLAARAHSPAFLKSIALEDPVAFWGTPFLGRLAGVGCLLALGAGAVELVRVLRRPRSSREESPDRSQ